MITLLTGENSFEIEEALRQIVSRFSGEPERIDGSDVTIAQIPDLFSGITLFSDTRLVIIKYLSDNKTVWNALESWIARASDDVSIVLVDAKPDKRTRTYKELQKVADIQTYQAWSERDVVRAEQWSMGEATRRGFSLDKKSAHVLVARVGVDQWLLSHALEKLMVSDRVSPDVIENIIEANPLENVFNILDAALRGDAHKVSRMISTLSLTEDPYKLFGLLSGQAFQLAVMSHAEQGNQEVARAIGAHPFALSKLAPHAKNKGKSGARNIIAIFSEADAAMKTSSSDPWLLIERALVKIANI